MRTVERSSNQRSVGREKDSRWRPPLVHSLHVDINKANARVKGVCQVISTERNVLLHPSRVPCIRGLLSRFVCQRTTVQHG
jgi:hypothetical protein